MFFTDRLRAAQREARRQVAEGEVYSLQLPIVGRVPVPSPRQLAIYAALGGLAALEIIDWPVAVAMGVGSTLVSRQLSDLEAREEELAQAIRSESPGAGVSGATVVSAAGVKKATMTAAAKKSAVTAPAGKPTAEAPAKGPAPKKPGAKKAAAKKAAPAAKKSPAKKAAPSKRTPPPTDSA